MNMSTQLLYNDFPTFLRKYFPYKVQKISLNGGFTCPNRDGTKGWGGKKLWVPNIKLPSNTMYYDVIEEDA